MLIIDNGAFKSGSSWLFKIISCMTNFPAPPTEYLNPTRWRTYLRSLKKGDIVLFPFPFTDLSASKVRLIKRNLITRKLEKIDINFLQKLDDCLKNTFQV